MALCLDDKVQFRLQWPTAPMLRFNGRQLRVVNRGNGTPLGIMQVCYTMEGKGTVAVSRCLFAASARCYTMLQLTQTASVCAPHTLLQRDAPCNLTPLMNSTPLSSIGATCELMLEYADPNHMVVLLAYIMRRRSKEQVKVSWGLVLGLGLGLLLVVGLESWHATGIVLQAS